MRYSLGAVALFAASVTSLAQVKVTSRNAESPIAARGFAAVVFDVENTAGTETECQLEASATAPLRLAGSASKKIRLPARATQVAVFNIYAPNGIHEGGTVRLTARHTATGAASSATQKLSVIASPAFSSKVFLPTGDMATVVSSTGDQPADFDLVLANTGNVPLELRIDAQCSPATAKLTGDTGSVALAQGETRKLRLNVRNIGGKVFSEAVAHLIVQTSHNGVALEAAHHFVRLENYPETAAVAQSDLYKQMMITIGGAAGFVGESALFLQTLSLDGEIAPGTLLRFDGQLATPSDPGISLPGCDARSQFRLSLTSEAWRIDAGEVAYSSGRLISNGGRGTGIAANVHLTRAVDAGVFVAQDTTTLSEKKTAALSASAELARHHTLHLDVLTRADDPNPETRDWTAAGAEWVFAPTKKFTLALQSAYGSSEHGAGGAIGATMLWRTAMFSMPLELGIESGAGDQRFPGDQRGRLDGRVALSIRPAANLRVNALYYRSRYESRPFFEKTIEELTDITPDFAHRVTSSDTSLSATWEKAMPVTLGINETSSFQKSLVDEKSRERAGTLVVSCFSKALNTSVTLRGGTEEKTGMINSSSSFSSAGFDASMPLETRKAFVTLNAAVRYTRNSAAT